MADVRRVGGPGNIPEGPSKKESSSVDPNEFKKIMDVDETDAEQKKKQKRPGEEVEEISRDVLESKPATDPSKVTPLSTTTKTGDPNAPSPAFLGGIDVTLPPSEIADDNALLEASAHDLAPGSSSAQLGPGGGIASITPLPPPPIPESKVDEVLKRKDKKIAKSAGKPMTSTSGERSSTPEPTPTPPEPISPPPPVTAYANLHPEVMELFDRMVGVITIMSMQGVTETTFTLNAPQFASSVFFGAQIIIREYSTAPKAFNVQMKGTQQAVALFQNNTKNLMAAFEQGNYNFRIQRLDTEYLTEKPEFRRKESSGGKQDQQGAK
ncbi:MAG: hypothetical protein JSS61_02055 [Verrucomicrobia bacterium]|nr:hypothetical protein [Verrucomicrobiota bacterium]